MAYRLTPVDKKEPSPLVEAGSEQQTCLSLCRFHEAGKIKKSYLVIIDSD